MLPIPAKLRRKSGLINAQFAKGEVLYLRGSMGCQPRQKTEPQLQNPADPVSALESFGGLGDSKARRGSLWVKSTDMAGQMGCVTAEAISNSSLMSVRSVEDGDMHMQGSMLDSKHLATIRTQSYVLCVGARALLGLSGGGRIKLVN